MRDFENKLETYINQKVISIKDKKKYEELFKWLIERKYNIYEKVVDFKDLYCVCLKYGNDETKVYITVGDPVKTVYLDYWHTDDPYMFNYIVNARCSGNPKIVSATHLDRKLWVELGDSYKEEIKEAEKEWAGEVVEWLDTNCDDKEFVEEMKEKYKKVEL